MLHPAFLVPASVCTGAPGDLYDLHPYPGLGSFQALSAPGVGDESGFVLFLPVSGIVPVGTAPGPEGAGETFRPGTAQGTPARFLDLAGAYPFAAVLLPCQSGVFHPGSEDPVPTLFPAVYPGHPGPAANGGAVTGPGSPGRSPADQGHAPDEGAEPPDPGKTEYLE